MNTEKENFSSPIRITAKAHDILIEIKKILYERHGYHMPFTKIIEIMGAKKLEDLKNNENE